MKTGKKREEIKGAVVSVSTYVWMEDLEEEENNFYSLIERQVVVKVLYVLQKLQTVPCIHVISPPATCCIYTCKEWLWPVQVCNRCGQIKQCKLVTFSLFGWAGSAVVPSSLFYTAIYTLNLLLKQH